MEDLLARERAAEKNVYQLLNPDYSIDSLLQALDVYCQLCQECVLGNIWAADQFESRLWAVHTEAKKYLHLVLGSFRKQGDQKAVATRQGTKDYLRFIKQSQTLGNVLHRVRPKATFPGCNLNYRHRPSANTDSLK